MRRQRWIARAIEQHGMRLARETQHAGNRDVGMPDTLAEPVRRGDAGALFFQQFQYATDLRFTTLDPDFRLILPQHALVEQADALVRKPGRQRADLQAMAPLSPARGDQSSFRSHQL